ncbi:hypothetical protein D3C86_1589740 [compost metagenome]
MISVSPFGLTVALSASWRKTRLSIAFLKASKFKAPSKSRDTDSLYAKLAASPPIIQESHISRCESVVGVIFSISLPPPNGPKSTGIKLVMFVITNNLINLPGYICPDVPHL